MKEIICKNGEIALCDDQDYPLLSRFIWYMGSEVKNGGGYPCCFIYGKNNTRKQIFMHQLVCAGATNMDHIDLNKLNNQSDNLRVATHQLNGWNKGKAKGCRHGAPTSQYKGVSYCPLRGKPRWKAHFKYVEQGKDKSTGKYICVGYFWSEEDAAKAYDKKVKEMRGEYAWTNTLENNNVQVV